jgi:hypothetical protein
MMKRVLAIVLGLCLLSGLSVNADIDTIEGSAIAGGGASCTDPVSFDITEYDGENTNNRTASPHGQSILATETGTIYSITIQVSYVDSADTCELRIGNQADLSSSYESETLYIDGAGDYEFVFDGALSVTNSQLFYIAFDSPGDGVGQGCDFSGNSYYTDGAYYNNNVSWSLSGGDSTGSMNFKVKYCD